MLDASDLGGGIVETQASHSELRAEARWAHRGGWSVFTGLESWSPNAVPDPDELDERDFPKLRAPPDASCP
eukprot:1811897-Alexandrium_andersonii.AAC.1